jgi:ATP-dependent Clp protease adaptor protein ClpS
MENGWTRRSRPSPKSNIMSDTDTDTLSQTQMATSPDVPWNVVVHDDPVNLMQYVTFVLMKIFGYAETKATILMMQVHKQGRSIVWSGEREKAEFYVQQLQAHQLKTSLEKAA